MWADFLMNLGWGVVLVISVAHLVPEMGSKGLADANLIAYSCLILSAISFTAFRYGRDSIRSIYPHTLCTIILFLFAFSIGKMAEPFSLSSAIILSIIAGALCWREIPFHHVRKIKDIFSHKSGNL